MTADKEVFMKNKIKAIAIGAGSMGIVGIGISFQLTIGVGCRRVIALQHQIAGAFAKIQPRTRGIERSAPFFVENHQ